MDNDTLLRSAGRAVNFATAWDSHPKAKFDKLHEKRPPFKDRAGFHWYFDDWPGEFSNELMVDRGFTIHADGWPLLAIGKSSHSGFLDQLTDQSGKLQIDRDFLPQLNGLFRLCLRVENKQPESVAPRIKILCLLKKPAVKVFSSNGKSWPATSGELPTAELGSAIAFASGEPTQPAAIFGIGAPGAKSLARVRLVDSKTIEFIYEPTLAPGANLMVSHFAAQLPLAAFPSAEDALKSLPIDQAQSEWEAKAGMPADNWHP